MSTPDSRSAHSPEASTDERASFFLLNPAGQPPESTAAPVVPAEPNEAFWAGVRHGIAALQRRSANPHLPPDLDSDLTRPSAVSPLTSSHLGDAFDAAPPPPAGTRAPRFDGWTSGKERIFCETLARCGVVADACRAAGMSRDAAYTRRNAASGRAFRLAWDAALLLARAPIDEAVMSRAMNGCVDRVYKDGVLVAERHRYDNRLTMAVLARLDRIAEGEAANSAAVRAAAEEFEQLLDGLSGGNAAAEAFLAPRLTSDTLEPPHFRGGRYARDEEPNLLARCAFKEKHGVGLPSDVPIDDLAGPMETWNDDQLRRAEASGYLASLDDEDDWPDLAILDDAEGACASAECPRHGASATDGGDAPGMCKLRKLYLTVHPYALEDPDEGEDEDADEEVDEEVDEDGEDDEEDGS